MQKGLSLIELLIVVAVVGILATIAYPSYNDQLRRAARVEAVSLLHDAALRLERHYSLVGQYDDGDRLVTPMPSGSRYYSVQAQRDGEGFRLLAKRLPRGLMEADRCGDFVLDQAGAQSNPGSLADTTDCWGS
ncbi:prepilin-type N-terminal cleavage/methylation domain-containing protein [Pseudomonas capeferrum]|uniref:type IV pilin protein n=1 Tax=Pseudomonas capeferrum TaxID=1495066 RepID=UPI0015E405EC|nr:type IV pilin protein [Pseudomonas capeferrum]MBA1202587.1 prepilin-type N-terminal cleavage/methylation domain-containing protein [Pseudomonas capeferrum]